MVILVMALEIEVVEAVESRDTAVANGGTEEAGNGGGEDEEILRNGMYVVAAYGDIEKLQRLVECEGCSVFEHDGHGYYALQWAALNNRTVAAQYIIEVIYLALNSNV